MVIWGWRSKVVEGGQVDGVTCPNCGHTAHRSYGLFRYFHLYFIPTIAYGKKVGLVCSHCRLDCLVEERPGIAPPLLQRLRAAVLPARRMLPYNAGAIAAAALLTVGVVGATVSNATEDGYVAAPHAQDIYVVRDNGLFPGGDPKLPYTLLLVRSVSPGGDVTLSPARHIYSSSSGAQRAIDAQADKPDEFLTATEVVPAADLARMRSNGTVVSVRRR